MGIYDREYYRDERSSFLGVTGPLRTGVEDADRDPTPSHSFFQMGDARNKIRGAAWRNGFSRAVGSRKCSCSTPTRVLHGQIWRFDHVCLSCHSTGRRVAHRTQHGSLFVVGGVGSRNGSMGAPRIHRDLLDGRLP